FCCTNLTTPLVRLKCIHLLLGVIREPSLRIERKLRLIPTNCMHAYFGFALSFSLCRISQSINVLINVGIVAENALNSIIKKDVVDMVCYYSPVTYSLTHTDGSCGLYLLF